MTRDEVIAKANSFAKPVPFTESPLCEFLRPLMADEVIEALDYQAAHGDQAGYRFLFVRAVCDEGGNRIFTDDDAALVGTFPAPQMAPIVVEIRTRNLMGDREKKAPSTTTQTSSSRTD